MFLVYYLAGRGNGSLLVRFVAGNKMLKAHVATYSNNNANTCFCFGLAHKGNTEEIRLTISGY